MIRCQWLNKCGKRWRIGNDNLVFSQLRQYFQREPSAFFSVNVWMFRTLIECIQVFVNMKHWIIKDIAKLNWCQVYKNNINVALLKLYQYCIIKGQVNTKLWIKITFVHIINVIHLISKDNQNCLDFKYIRCICGNYLFINYEYT